MSQAARGKQRAKTTHSHTGDEVTQVREADAGYPTEDTWAEEARRLGKDRSHNVAGLTSSPVTQDVYQADASPSAPPRLHRCEGEGHGGHHPGAGGPRGFTGEPEGVPAEQTQPGQAARPGAGGPHAVPAPER